MQRALWLFVCIMVGGYIVGRVLIAMDPGFDPPPRNLVLEEEYRDVVRRESRGHVAPQPPAPVVIYQAAPNQPPTWGGQGGHILSTGTYWNGR